MPLLDGIQIKTSSKAMPQTTDIVIPHSKILVNTFFDYFNLEFYYLCFSAFFACFLRFTKKRFLLSIVRFRRKMPDQALRPSNRFKIRIAAKIHAMPSSLIAS